MIVNGRLVVGVGSPAPHAPRRCFHDYIADTIVVRDGVSTMPEEAVPGDVGEVQ
ncbi:MAG: hypothetical protein ACLFVJ_23685 [Persicimonas sp.]